MLINLAARRSDLARIQAFMVGRELAKLGHEVRYQFRESLGDRQLDEDLRGSATRGVFTQDFVEDLLKGTADVVVHSWKDLPTEERVDTQVVATLDRADVRDMLLVRRDRQEKVRSSQKIQILTSSPRRERHVGEFVREFLPLGCKQIEFTMVRGNVPTRLRKLLQHPTADALVMAKAALDRLLTAEGNEFRETQEGLLSDLAQTQWSVLPISISPPAAGQGALALEIRADRTDLQKVLETFSNANAFACVQDEREVLKGFGGGCEQKIGIHVMNLHGGRYKIIRGQTLSGQILDQKEFHPWLKMPRTSPDKIYRAENSIKPRIKLPLSAEDQKKLLTNNWMVSRAEAWPDLPSPELVWTSGLKTWRKLMQKGIWVNGSMEGLGEWLGANLNGWNQKPWVKLTHDQAEKFGSRGAVATYQLGQMQLSDLGGKTHFYWSSASEFSQAVKQEPSILKGWHACGPGLTFDYINSNYLDISQRLCVFPDVESWMAQITEKEAL